MNTDTDQKQTNAKQDSLSCRQSLRELLLLMPYLTVLPTGKIDWDAADPALLYQIQTHAEISMRRLCGGIAGIGQLLAITSHRVATTSLAAEAIESVGNLLAELGELGNAARSIEANCKIQLTDYAPKTCTTIHAASA